MAKQWLTRYLLYALVLSLGFGQLMRLELYGLQLFVHDILVVFLIPLLLIDYKERILVIPRGLKLLLLGLLLGWIRALTLYPAVQLLIPFMYTLRLLAYLTLYHFIPNTKYQIPNTIFFLSGLVTLAIGLLQYFLLPDMRVFQFLGWDDHLNRLTLPHYDPTFTGVMLVMYLILLSPYNIQNILYSIPYAAGILLTYSRSVWLSLIITVSMFIKKKIYLLGIFPILLVAILLVPKKFGEGNNLLRTYSITSRLESDLSYFRNLGWDLITGRGMNTLVLETPVSRYPNHATGPNNSYLYLLATTGIIGLVGWGIFLKSLYIDSKHHALITFVVITSLFNNVMFYPFSLLLMLLTNLKPKD